MPLCWRIRGLSYRWEDWRDDILILQRRDDLMRWGFGIWWCGGVDKIRSLVTVIYGWRSLCRDNGIDYLWHEASQVEGKHRDNEKTRRKVEQTTPPLHKCIVTEKRTCICGYWRVRCKSVNRHGLSPASQSIHRSFLIICHNIISQMKTYRFLRNLAQSDRSLTKCD